MCGSFRCGCGVTSSPAVSGAIGGELPSIVVAGSGEAGDPYDLSLNDAWAAEVVSELTATTTAVNALGVKGVAKTSGTDQNGIGVGATDITGLSVTWTAVASRVYRYSLNVGLSKAATADFVSVTINTGAGTVLVLRSSWLTTTDFTAVHLEWTETGLSGSQTRKAQAATNSGTTNIVNSFSRNGILIVEDIGPA